MDNDKNDVKDDKNETNDLTSPDTMDHRNWSALITFPKGTKAIVTLALVLL